MKQRLRLSRDAWRRLEKKLDTDRALVGFGTRLAYSVAAAGNSLLARLQNLSHAQALKAVEVPPPIFLLGFWRSGTTFLHELFCCDPQFGFPTTYACLNPAHFLLTEKAFHERVTKQPTLRPMDNMQYSWISPQEDEFALLCMGAPSPYESLLAPSLMQDPRPLLDLRARPSEELDRFASTLQLFLRLLTVQQSKAMVLKSPPHGFRLFLLSSLFPGARYVIIERNPYEVFASNLKLWKTLLDRYSLESTSPQQIETFILAAYLVHETAITEGIRSLPPGTISRVRYEDVVADPLGQLRRIYAELELPSFEVVRPRLEQHLARVSNHQRNRFVLSPEQKATVDDLWHLPIRDKGYTWSEGWLSLSPSA